jgi:cell division septation protein DedD
MTREMRDLDKIREDYEVRLGNREFKGMVAATIAIGLLLFFLGFLVGRQFPAKSSSDTLATEDLQNPESQEGVADTRKVEEGQDKNTFDFYNELAKDETKADQPVTQETSPAPTLPETSSAPSAASSEESPKVEAEVPDQVARRQTQPPAQETTTIPSLYTIQVGAFEEGAVAENMAKQLQKKGYPSYTVIKTLPDKGVWHRVRVGKYKTRKEAERVAADLEQREHLSWFITLYAQ